MKISIITISFNSEKTIEQTIKSIIFQKNENVEYIIIDGLSTDNTMDIISKYKDNIDIVVSEKDKGISDAFNKGIELASGDLIGIINSDDILAPGAISNIINEIKEDTEVFFGNLIMIKENGEKFLKKPDTNLEKLMKNMSLMHPATFIKKTAYEKYGLYSLDYKCVMDRELLLRMYTGKAKFQYIDRELAYYRLGGISSKQALKITIPENERISIDYGVTKLKARLTTIKNKIKFMIVNIFRKLGIENNIRKIISKM